MKMVCCECGVVYGKKEPFDDNSETHGYCTLCFHKIITAIHLEKKTCI